MTALYQIMEIYNVYFVIDNIFFYNNIRICCFLNNRILNPPKYHLLLVLTLTNLFCKFTIKTTFVKFQKTIQINILYFKILKFCGHN